MINNAKKYNVLSKSTAIKPINLESSINKRVTVDFDNNIRTIFAPGGELITVIQK